jgi:hypothetical protein
VAIFRSEAEVLDEAGRRLGSGMAYVHLPMGRERDQEATGTVSLRSWEPSDEPPALLVIGEGRRLPIAVSRDALSECSRNRILRFTARWTPEPAADPEG